MLGHLDTDIRTVYYIYVSAMIDKSHKSAGQTGRESHKRKHKPKGVSDLVKMKELSVHELSVVRIDRYMYRQIYV